MRLYEKLEQLREKRGISVRELARQIGVRSDTTVWRWLKGEAEPKFSEAVRVAAFFGIDLYYLIDDGTAEVNPLFGLSEDDRYILRAVRSLGLDADEAVRRLAVAGEAGPRGPMRVLGDRDLSESYLRRREERERDKGEDGSGVSSPAPKRSNGGSAAGP